MLVLDAWEEFVPLGILSLPVALPGLALFFQPSLSWEEPSLDTTASMAGWGTAVGAIPEQQGGEPGCHGPAPGKPQQIEGEAQETKPQIVPRCLVGQRIEAKVWSHLFNELKSFCYSRPEWLWRTD